MKQPKLTISSLSAGQSLVEVVLALAVILIIVVALVRVVTISIKNAEFAKNQALATRFAQDAIEKIRFYRESNSWGEFVTACNNGTIDLGTPPPNFGLSPDMECYRPVPPEPYPPCAPVENVCEVKITVPWAQGSLTHVSELTTRLTNWE
jgi:type II secretory pathway pseudopilin PulG